MFFFGFTMIELTLLFVGISFLVGLINEFLPQDKVKRWLSGRNGRGYVIGSILGGLTPFCSCSTIPVTIGLLKAQAGFGPTMAETVVIQRVIFLAWAPLVVATLAIGIFPNIVFGATSEAVSAMVTAVFGG